MNNGREQFELDNFNLNSEEADWGSPERDPRAVGNRAIFSPEQEPAPASPEQAIDFELPPGVSPEQILQSENPSPAPVAAYDKNALKTADRLTKEGVKVVDGAIRKLNRDGDIASFYDTARDMMEVNIGNSYNRKLGESAS